jgi:hypothetical protein
MDDRNFVTEEQIQPSPGNQKKKNSPRSARKRTGALMLTSANNKTTQIFFCKTSLSRRFGEGKQAAPSSLA